MKKKELIKSILIILGLAIIVGGLIVYKKGIDKDIEEIDLGEEVVNTDTVDEDKEVLVKDDKYLENESNINKVNNDAKFNEYLTLANKSFLDAKYDQAIVELNQALKYKNSDLVYVRISSAYGAKGDFANALSAIDKAISLNPTFTEYWNTKLTILDDKMTTSFEGLKAVYEQALAKVDNRTKPDLVTNFARIAENNQKIDEAISAWNYAKAIYPDRSSIYQAEIDRLKTLK
jgi:tetratricopeptide (TPR) repeat protein